MLDDMVYEVDTDLWITSKGSSGSLHSPSLLPMAYQNALENYTGVESVTPLIRHAVSIRPEGSNVLLFLNGYVPDTGIGAPWSISSGASDVNNGEIILDYSFSIKYGYEIGDTIALGEQSYKIVGISDKTNLFVGYMAFLTYEDARLIIPENLTNYFLVKTSNPDNLIEVKNSIESSYPELSASTSDTIAKNYKAEVLGSFLPIVSVLVVIAVCVGILIVGLMLYTSTIEKESEFGLLKAIGASNFYLLKLVLAQALFISIAGMIIGVVVSYPLISLVQRYIPEFVIEISPTILIILVPLLLATGIIASVIPVKRISRIDPAEVFNN